MKLQYDLPLTIYTGAHRNSKTWKRAETSWAALLEKLAETAVTGETSAEYRAMTKTERAERKDVGGFVGGILKDGRRNNASVVSRSIVALDADRASTDFMGRVRGALQGIAWAVYSTHSHTAEAPRLRVLIPLAEPVEPDAYQAIARRLAADIDIEAMDDTTYEPARLMFWPSVPSDGEYFFDFEDAPALVPADALARYTDWRDVSEWPTSKREVEIVRHAAKKQEDPRAKGGIIGAFCRAHPIEEAIASFLSDVYAPCGEGRYTFIGGSTTGGLVIYDGCFAYSYHSTDPACERLCNAFDLVRLHLFGEADRGADARTPTNKLPSFKKMTEMAMADEATRTLYREEHDADIMASLTGTDAEGLEEEGAAGDKETEEAAYRALLSDLQRDRRENILPNSANCIAILSRDPKLKGRIGRDDFAHRFMLRGGLPWRDMGNDRFWRDADDACLRNYFSRHYGISARQVIDDALTEVMAANAFHPVREYLKSLTWDGIPRAEAVYTDFLGAEDSAYVRMVTRLHLKAAVARVTVPGTKFDQCLVLSGPQGIGKSTVLRCLGRDWFNDGLVTFQGKDPMEQLQGAWINELSEMQATSKAENDQIKAFLSRSSDRFRAPYGRRTEEFPRQCVFAATTNDSVFLKDRTGGRRFWPVFCSGGAAKSLDELDEAYVDQVWAEVAEWYKEDRSLLLPRGIAEEARALQEMHTEGSEKAGLVADYLEKLLPERWKDLDLYERKKYLEHYGELDQPEGVIARDKVCTLEIWCEVFEGSKTNFTSANARELNAIMQAMPGWRAGRAPRFFGNLYGKQRAFIRFR